MASTEQRSKISSKASRETSPKVLKLQKKSEAGRNVLESEKAIDNPLFGPEKKMSSFAESRAKEPYRMEKKEEERDAYHDAQRKLGGRRAAPWAAKHAAKHAAEARARASDPAMPGSARATLRTPIDAEELKARIAELHQAQAQVKALKKNLGKHFYEIGSLLRTIEIKKLYEAKGIGSFEAYVEKETDLGKLIGLRLAKMVSLFQKEASLELGIDKVLHAMAALEAPTHTADPKRQSKLPKGPMTTSALPLKPPGRA